MIRALIKKQLMELFQTYFVNRKTGKARGRRGMAGYIALGLLVFGGVGVAFHGMATKLGQVMLGRGFNWLYFALMGLLAIALGAFGSVFNTYASLYMPKDNEALLALPIPPGRLLVARVAGVYATSLLYSAWVWIPAVIAGWELKPVDAPGIAFPVLLSFVIALFVTVLSCALGWVVALVASKTKGRSFLTVFLSLFVMAAYYVVYFRVASSLGEIVARLDSIGAGIKSWLGYVYLLGRAADGEALPMLWIALITAALAGVCLFVLSRTFMRIALAESRTDRRSRRADGYLQRSPRRALLAREYRNFTSKPTWMLNGGLGLLFMPVGAVALIVKREAVQGLLSLGKAAAPDILAALPVFAFAAICLVASVNVVSAASVSMEGRNLWIVQTLPVDAWDALRAKRDMDRQLNLVPALPLSIVAGFVLGFEIWDVALMTCALWLYLWLKTDLGLMLNLKRPTLNWTNAAVPTKQGLPVLLQMIGCWLLCALFALGGYFAANLVGASLALAACAALLGVGCALSRRWLRTRGAGILAAL